MRHQTILHIFIILFSLLFSACSSKSKFMQQDRLQAEGKYSEAVKFAQEHIDIDDKSDIDSLLWELYLGQSQFFNNDFNGSIRTFDEAETRMKYHRESILATSIAQGIKSTLTNDNIRPYIGNAYDGIMLNTYKALAYLQKKDYSSARVEFNRALDRQRRAKEFFYASVQKEQEALNKEQADNNTSAPVPESVQESEYQGVINRHYPEMNLYKVYPDFVNPMTNYLSALFALANSDSSKAEFLLKQTAAMLPDNMAVQSEYQELAQTQSEENIWLIYEEGLAPVLDEMRVDFPAWIFTNQVNYVSIALPRMIERQGALDYLSIRDGNETLTQTQLLSSMERVMQTEFKKHYPRIMKRAVMSSISKAVMQNVANDSNNNLAAFVTTVYAIVSTQADTRIWTALPKNFHLAKFKKEERQSIDIYTPYNQKIASLDLIPAKHTLIYVKIPTLAHKVHISIFSLGETP